MMGVESMLAYGADQKSVNAYGTDKLVSAKNNSLYSVVVTNKSATDFWVQIYDVTGADEAAAGTAADSAEPEFEAQCYAGSFLPFAFPGGWRMRAGTYIRCVTAAGGSSSDLIASDDARITASFMDGPIG